jgi:SAM-dependent methyltransferase
MAEPAHLEMTRNAYDAVAADYAEMLDDELDSKPVDRGLLAAFADLVRGKGGLVADLGCGPGRITAHLDSLGVTALGLDLSPAMVAQAQERHPHLPFDQGSLAGLELADRCLVGAVAWYSIIHTPTEELPGVVAELHRVLAPGGYLLLAFQAGDNEQRKRKEAYGHPVALVNYLHSPDHVEELLGQAGLAVETRVLREPDDSGFESVRQAYLLARKAG